MDLGIVSQWFDPETGPASLPGTYAREFVRQGHAVRVLTGFPNYPQGTLYPGYKMVPRDSEVSDGVQVTRVALFPDHGRSVVRRAVNYLSYAFSATTLGAGALAGVDAVWAYSSPTTVALPLLAHTRLGSVPYFLHVQDLWPDSLVNSGMFDATARLSGAIISLTEVVTRLVETRAAAVGVISPGVKALLLDRNPRLDESRIRCVLNPTDERRFQPTAPRRDLESAPWRRPFTVMYVGAVGAVQGLDTLLDAAERLRSQRDIGFVVIGDGLDAVRLRRRVVEEKIDNVWFLGRVNQAEVPDYMASSDVQLVCLRDEPFLRLTMPSKIPAILASGLPIIGQVAGDPADLINGSGAGVVVDPGNADSLADAVLELSSHSEAELIAMGGRGRDFYFSTMSAQSAVSIIASALSD